MKLNKKLAVLGAGLLTSTGAIAQTFYQCMPCSPGTYSSGGKCVACKEGTYSASGATSCTSCTAGTYSKAGAGSCTLCPEGQYQDKTGQSSCKPCPTTITEFSSCDFINIFDLFTCRSLNENACKEQEKKGKCRAKYKTYSVGYVSNSNRTDCTICSSGTGKSGNTCKICEAGTYSDLGLCTPCPAGTYSGKIGATSSETCTPCPAGMYSTEVGATSSATCKACPAGHYCPGTGKAIQCPAGHYQTKTGQTSCDACGSVDVYVGYATDYNINNVCNDDSCSYKFDTPYICAEGKPSNHYCSYGSTCYPFVCYIKEAKVSHGAKFQVECGKTTGKICLKEIGGSGLHCYN